MSCSDRQTLCNCMQAYVTACKLMELHASLWNCMKACNLMELNASLCNCIQAFATACKLMELDASFWNCMQAHGTVCKLMNQYEIMELGSLGKLRQPWATLGNLRQPWATLSNLRQPWVTLANLWEPWNGQNYKLSTDRRTDGQTLGLVELCLRS